MGEIWEYRRKDLYPEYVQNSYNYKKIQFENGQNI